MLRTTGFVTAWLATVLLACCASAQDAAPRRMSRVVSPGRPGRVVTEGRIIQDRILREGRVLPQDRPVTDGHAAPDRSGSHQMPQPHPAGDRQAPQLEISIPAPAGVPPSAPYEARKPTDRGRDISRMRKKKAPPANTVNTAESLEEFGASGPFEFSARGGYLVAAMGDGGGLAIWETNQRKRLHRLENSERTYALVTISPESRWIAGVRHDDHEQIDLWRADNGRHMGVVRAAGGAKERLVFRAPNELLVLASDGNERVFSVPTGVALSGPEAEADEEDDTRGPKPPAVGKSARPLGRGATKGGAAPSIAPAVPQPAPRWTQREPRIPVTPPAAAPHESGDLEYKTFSSKPSAAPPAASPKTDAPEAAQETEDTQESDEPIAAPAARMPDEAAAEPGSPAPPDDGAFDVSREPSGGAAPPTADEGAVDDGAAADIAPGASGSAAPDAVIEDSPAVGSAAPASDAPDTNEPGSAAPDWADSDAAAPSAAAPGSAAPNEESTSEAADPSEASAAPEGARRYEVRVDEPFAAAPEASAPVEAQPAAVEPSPASKSDPSTVNIHYATNRNRLTPKDRELMVYFVGFFGSLPAFVIYGMMLAAVLILPWLGRRSWGAWGVMAGVVVLCSMGLLEAYIRSQLRDELTGELYGCRASEISYGTCQVSVPPPDKRRPGELSRPLAMWVFEASESPDRHFMLRHVEEHADKDAFYRSLSAQLKKSDDQAALLFIHGYNVSFEDAIFRTAQLAVDLKFPGAPVTFSWPSYADPMKYAFDETNAEVSILALREVLDDLASRSGAKRIHIIAHSMGNRVLAGSLQNLEAAKESRNKEVIHELVLAAPDIDSRVFRSQVLPHLARDAQHCTLYASSRDRALHLSRFFHNYQRLGETLPELVVADGLDTIDASLVDTSLLGHSYIGDVATIVSDLHDLVVRGKRPAERTGLMSLERNALKYWSLQPPVETATDGALRR